MLGLERSGNLIQVRLGLLEADTGFQPRDAGQVDRAEARIARALVGRDNIRHPELGRTGGPDRVLESGRHDPGDLIGAPFERDRPADDGRIPTEAASPQTITEHRDAVGPVHLVLGAEGPPDRRPSPEHVEE